MGWHDAVQDSAQGVHLLLEVTAGARAAAFPAGYNPWRRRIGVRVRAAAQAGAANAEVVARVAAVLEVPVTDVRIAAGAGDRRKTVVVRGVTRPEVVRRLAAAW